MMAILREPLLHFLLLGTMLFIVYEHGRQDQAVPDTRTIEVNRDKLLSYIEYRLRIFDAERSNAYLDSLPPPELQRLITAYVREEAIYREAKTLGLDQEDYVARLRLVQQLESALRGFADMQAEPSDREVEQHYEAHKPEYAVQPKVTFTHVFFSSDVHGPLQAEALARQELLRLNRDRVPFERAPAYGEHFLYGVNYVQRAPELVASHFGTQMQRQLFDLERSQIWRGPFRSSHGYHLVLLTDKQSGYLPPFAQVQTTVARDARDAKRNARFEEEVRLIMTAYRVQMAPVHSRPPPG
jgi:hypothetical protein